MIQMHKRLRLGERVKPKSVPSSGFHIQSFGSQGECDKRQKRRPFHSLACSFASGPPNSCDQGINRQCLRSQGSAGQSEQRPLLFVSGYLICIYLCCRAGDLGLWSTCYSWLLALGWSQNRGKTGRTPKRPEAHLHIRLRSGRSFLKPFGPNNASCLKSEAAPRGMPGSPWEAE